MLSARFVLGHTIRNSVVLALFVLFALPAISYAATMSLSPSTGVYSLGSTFTVSVVLNTKGEPVNAADATLSFNPKELSVVSLNKGSIFNLWTAEPSFSNSAGTVTFSGGTPAGYTGSNGVVVSVTFRTVSAATARVSMTSGSVLAADGRGTNVLSSMGGGTYTISAATAQPAPEVIVEYVPPANTPASPVIKSDTHPAGEWSKESTARLTWNLPSDVTAMRTLLDSSPSSIPTKVYDTPVRELTLSDLDNGVSYFHLQFQNKDGWGKVAHYRLAVDNLSPAGLALTLPSDANLVNPNQTLLVTGTTTEGAPIVKYKVQINGADPVEIIDEKATGIIPLPALVPGYQTVVVEAFDAAGNSSVVSYSFTIDAFTAPLFTDYPPELSPGIIPVIRGETRPRSTVEVTVESGSAEPRKYTVTAGEDGVFTFIPDGSFATGVYKLTAVATDEFGAVSSPSEAATIAVQPSGIMRIGSFMVSVLSMLLSLFGLLVLSVLFVLYTTRRWRVFRGSVGKEAAEVTASIDVEFAKILKVVDTEEEKLVSGRKTKKLTAAEAAFIGEIRGALKQALTTVEKEADDVTRIIEKK